MAATTTTAPVILRSGATKNLAHADQKHYTLGPSSALQKALSADVRLSCYHGWRYFDLEGDFAARFADALEREREAR